MRYLSLFTGIGGFELGIHQAYVDTINRTADRASKTAPATKEDSGHQKPQSATAEDGRTGEHTDRRADGEEPPACVGYSEIDPYAINIYQKHFPTHKNYGDITKINEKELPDFDLLVGGFPCQSFSIAGLRRGFDDTRGTLFFEIARIVREKQPRLLLLENVKGLLSHDNGNTFYTIVSALDELGYDVQWQVLNSKNHGVPQNRERVFIAGHLRGTPRPEVFPLTRSDGDPAQRDSQGTGITTDTITARYASRNGRGTHLKQIGTIGKDSEATRVYDTTGLARTIKNGGGMGAKTGLYVVQKSPDWRKDRTLRTFEKTAPTLRSQMGDNHPMLTDGAEIRRLTPLECERLQGFPDNWTEGVSDSQRYKCCGNAVTVNVVRDVVKHMLNVH